MTTEISSAPTQRVINSFLSSTAALGPNQVFETEQELIPETHLDQSDRAVTFDFANKLFEVATGRCDVVPGTTISYNVWALLMSSRSLRTMMRPYKNIRFKGIKIIMTMTANAFAGQNIVLSYVPGFHDGNKGRHQSSIVAAFNRASSPQVSVVVHPTTPYEMQNLWPNESVTEFPPCFGTFGISFLSNVCVSNVTDPTGTYKIAIQLIEPSFHNLCGNDILDGAAQLNFFTLYDAASTPNYQLFSDNYDEIYGDTHTVPFSEFIFKNIGDAAADTVEEGHLTGPPEAVQNTITSQTNSIVDNRKGRTSYAIKDRQEINSLHPKPYLIHDLVSIPGHIDTVPLLQPAGHVLYQTYHIPGTIHSVFGTDSMTVKSALQFFSIPAMAFMGSIKYIFMFNLPANVTMEIMIVKRLVSQTQQPATLTLEQASNYEAYTYDVGGKNSMIEFDYNPAVMRVVQPTRASQYDCKFNYESYLEIYVISASVPTLLNAEVSVIQMAGPDFQLLEPHMSFITGEDGGDNGYAGYNFDKFQPNAPAVEEGHLTGPPEEDIKPDIKPSFATHIGPKTTHFPGSTLVIDTLDQLSFGGVPVLLAAKPTTVIKISKFQPIPLTPAIFRDIPCNLQGLLCNVFFGFISENPEIIVKGDQDGISHTSMPPIGLSAIKDDIIAWTSPMAPEGNNATSLNPNGSYFAQTALFPMHRMKYYLLAYPFAENTPAYWQARTRRGGEFYPASFDVSAFNVSNNTSLHESMAVFKFNPQFVSYRGIPTEMAELVQKNMALFITGQEKSSRLIPRVRVYSQVPILPF